MCTTKEQQGVCASIGADRVQCVTATAINGWWVAVLKSQLRQAVALLCLHLNPKPAEAAVRSPAKSPNMLARQLRTRCPAGCVPGEKTAD